MAGSSSRGSGASIRTKRSSRPSLTPRGWAAQSPSPGYAGRRRRFSAIRAPHHRTSHRHRRHRNCRGMRRRWPPGSRENSSCSTPTAPAPSTWRKPAQAASYPAPTYSDLNKDGTLDKAESTGRLSAQKQAAAGPDKDGTITSNGYPAVVLRRFKAVCPDNDGTLDIESSRKAAPAASSCASEVARSAALAQAYHHVDARNLVTGRRVRQLVSITSAFGISTSAFSPSTKK